MNTDKTVDTDGTIIEFLNGSHSYDGVWFGDKHRTKEGAYWWRKILRDYIEASQFQHPVPANEISAWYVFSCNIVGQHKPVWKFFYKDKNGLNQHSGVYFSKEDAIKGRSDFITASHPVPDEAGEGKGWVSVEDRLPENIEGKDYSENVFAWCNNQLMVMCLALVPDDNNKMCYAWCNCGGKIDGDGEFDDNYYPTHWKPLPPKP